MGGGGGRWLGELGYGRAMGSNVWGVEFLGGGRSRGCQVWGVGGLRD